MAEEDFNSKTDWFETAIQSWAFNNTDMPNATPNVEVALHTGDPTNSGDSNEVNTVDYERATVPVANITTTGNNPRTATNTEAILFVEAETNWGTVTHSTIWQPVIDQPLYWGEFAIHRNVNEGEQYEIDVGDLIVRDF